jgi:DNA-binding MarR family transcriptional regulator
VAGAAGAPKASGGGPSADGSGIAPAPDADEEIVEHLFALVDRLRSGYEQVVACFELSAPQAKALHYVSEAGPVPMRDLACRLRCDASNVTGIVDRLEQRGLVERQSAPDRRVKSLVATPRGAEVARAVWMRVMGASVGAGELSASERDQLLRLLRRLDQPSATGWTG